VLNRFIQQSNGELHIVAIANYVLPENAGAASAIDEDMIERVKRI
jgi:hypothetical protein